ncbi:MAG TPA: biotin/lipoyl-containing protein, partial [Acidimicrobiales bacterium]|nr:biotin/lipoyl-containing protein [Acidimicrobiales bacterium]
MTVELRLPHWGMGITDGTVVSWLKAVGDPVTEDEPVVEIETAKVTDFVGAPATGILSEIHAEVGTVVAAGG